MFSRRPSRIRTLVIAAPPEPSCMTPFWSAKVGMPRDSAALRKAGAMELGLGAGTHIPGFLPMTPNDDPLARRALFVAFEGMGLLDLTGPLTVFWSASTFMKQQGRHGLRPAYGQPRQLHACAQLNRTCLSHRRRSAFRVPGSARRRGGASFSFN